MGSWHATRHRSHVVTPSSLPTALNARLVRRYAHATVSPYVVTATMVIRIVSPPVTTVAAIGCRESAISASTGPAAPSARQCCFEQAYIVNNASGFGLVNHGRPHREKYALWRRLACQRAGLRGTAPPVLPSPSCPSYHSTTSLPPPSSSSCPQPKPACPAVQPNVATGGA